MRALVVDDASSIRFMVRILLEDTGVAVEEAGSGAAALERLADQRAPRIDTLVIDQRMPDMSGLEVAREIAGREPRPRVLLFTSYLDPGLEDEAGRLDVTPVLKTDLPALVAAVSGEDRLAA
jgi:CheY-like chemotaxis protein